MSRIQDALKRAEESRNVRTQSASAIPADATATSAQLDDEVRQLEASLAAWRVQPAAPAVTPPPADAQHQKPSGVRLCEEDIRRAHAALAACEERRERSRQQCAALQGQVTEQERVVAQAATHLAVLQQRLQESEALVQGAEAEQAACGERLAALRQCQALAQAATDAEQHLQANTETIARIALVQQRVTEKLSQHQREAQELRATAAQMRQRLTEALARAQSIAGSTTNGGGRHE